MRLSELNVNDVALIQSGVGRGLTVIVEDVYTGADGKPSGCRVIWQWPKAMNDVYVRSAFAFGVSDPEVARVGVGVIHTTVDWPTPEREAP